MISTMLKTIKVEDQVHQDLENLRGKRETFSQTVARLIRVYREVHRIAWSHSGEHPRIPTQGG